VKVSVYASVVRNLYALLCSVESQAKAFILVRFKEIDWRTRQFGDFVGFLGGWAQKPRFY